MQAKLVVVEGNTKTREIELRLPMVVGRGRAVSLKIAHSLVSREHCELFESEGTLMVRDLGSLNGTFVDGQRIEGTAPLNSGHLLSIGTITFRAEYVDAKATQGGAKDETAIGMLPGPVDAATQPAISPDDDEPVDIDVRVVFDEVENANEVTDMADLPVRVTDRKKK